MLVLEGEKKPNVLRSVQFSPGSHVATLQVSIATPELFLALVTFEQQQANMELGWREFHPLQGFFPLLGLHKPTLTSAGELGHKAAMPVNRWGRHWAEKLFFFFFSPLLASLQSRGTKVQSPGALGPPSPQRIFPWNSWSSFSSFPQTPGRAGSVGVCKLRVFLIFLREKLKYKD